MEIKDRLKEIAEMDRRITGKLQEIDDMRNTLKAIDYSGECAKSSSVPDLSTLIARIDERNKEVEHDIDVLCDKKAALSKIVDSKLDGDEWEIIHYKYFCRNYSWRRLERKMFKSKSTLHRLHKSALDKLSNN